MKARITLDSGTKVWADSLIVNFSREDVPLDGAFLVTESLADYLSGLSDFVLGFEFSDCVYVLQVVFTGRDEVGRVLFKMLSVLSLEF